MAGCVSKVGERTKEPEQPVQAAQVKTSNKRLSAINNTPCLKQVGSYACTRCLGYALFYGLAAHGSESWARSALLPKSQPPFSLCPSLPCHPLQQPQQHQVWRQLLPLQQPPSWQLQLRQWPLLRLQHPLRLCLPQLQLQRQQPRQWLQRPLNRSNMTQMPPVWMLWVTM